jgi:hypothetical protein
MRQSLGDAERPCRYRLRDLDPLRWDRSGDLATGNGRYLHVERGGLKLMMHHQARALECFALAAFVLLPPAQSECQTGVSESDSSVLVLRLESSQLVYASGDSIKVRLTLRNTLAEEIRLHSSPLMGRAQIVVYDSTSSELPRGYALYPWRTFSGPATRTLGPWREITFKGADGRYWTDLIDWGYDIRVPGRYTIVAVPHVTGEPPASVDTTNPPSISITVEPRSYVREGTAAVALLALVLTVLALRGRSRSRVA